MTGESIRQQLASASARAQSLPSRARPTWTRPFGESKPPCVMTADRWIETDRGPARCPNCGPQAVAS